MPNIPANTTEAHTIVLHSMVNDMREVLTWMTIGLASMCALNILTALGDVHDRDWWATAWHTIVAASFAWWAWGTSKRARRYGRAKR